MRSLCKVFPLLVLLFAIPSFAEDKTLQVCVAGGYFSGAEDRFMSGLAMHILQKKGVFDSAPCSAAWRGAYDVGVSFSKSGRVANNSEAEIAKQAAQFSAKAYSAVAKGMEP
jgi:hypothetical protein